MIWEIIEFRVLIWGRLLINDSEQSLQVDESNDFIG